MESEQPPTSALLDVRGLRAGYRGNAIIEDLALTVASGEVVALMGANGAGKTTTMMTLAGYLPIIGGSVMFDGELVNHWPGHKLARNGLSFVPEARIVLSRLSTRDNLRVGRCDIETALELFPELRPLMRRRGGSLSGGEQQMLSLARAIASRPKILLVDELSLGLAPQIVQRLLKAVEEASQFGIGVLLVEQHAANAFQIADRVCIMRRGRLVFEGTPEAAEEALVGAYL
jgi:ABC-type branched-subunit amino acid transport system ATPase component